MKFKWSQKLEKLFKHIEEIDDDERMADIIFSTTADKIFAKDDISICDLLNEGDTITKWYYVCEQDNVCYMFEDHSHTSETQIYNKVLRSWCKRTNRKIKKKS